MLRQQLLVGILLLQESDLLRANTCFTSVLLIVMSTCLLQPHYRVMHLHAHSCKLLRIFYA